MSAHVCSVPGCGRTIDAHLVMCLDHWRRVPPLLQSQVYAVFRQYRQGRKSILDLRAIQVKATAAAVESAPGKGGAA